MGHFSDILLSCGTDAELIKNGTSRIVKIMINPENIRGDGTHAGVLGETNTVRYRCVFDGELNLDEIANAVLLWDEREFDILNSEKFTVEGEVSHIEAVLKQREELYYDGN